jgi:nucleoside-diphosphate-sugar epimerase
VVAGRDPANVPSEFAGARFEQLDRTADSLVQALEPGADVLVDIVAHGREDAEQLLAVCSLVGSFVVVSSAAVYVDAAGRSLADARTADDVPVLPVPVPETNPTVSPGTTTYAARKVALEQELLDAGVDVTIVRPSAVHGPGPGLPREWHFVKRALDRRPHLVLADRGRSVFHTTSVANLAELIRLAADRPGRRVLNCGDPEAPTALDISRAIASAVGHDRTEVLLPTPVRPGEPGDHPWAAPDTIRLDVDAAGRLLAYRPVATYADTVAGTCAFLVEATRGRDWRTVFADSAGRFEGSFEYGREDEVVASLAS